MRPRQTGFSTFPLTTVCLEDLSPQDSVGRQEQRRKLTHMDKVGWKGNSCFRKPIAAASQDILLQRFLFGGGGALLAKGSFICNFLSRTKIRVQDSDSLKSDETIK